MSSITKPPTGGSFLHPSGGVDSTSVTLRFFGDALDPAEVSRQLGAEPTLSRRKGDVITGQEGRVAETGSWLLSSERQSKSPLELQIAALFGRLTSDLSVWKQLSATYYADLFCGLWSEAFNRGTELSPEILRMIAERGLRLGLDVYFVEPKDE